MTVPPYVAEQIIALHGTGQLFASGATFGLAALLFLSTPLARRLDRGRGTHDAWWGIFPVFGLVATIVASCLFVNASYLRWEARNFPDAVVARTLSDK